MTMQSRCTDEDLTTIAKMIITGANGEVTLAFLGARLTRPHRLR